MAIIINSRKKTTITQTTMGCSIVLNKGIAISLKYHVSSFLILTAPLSTLCKGYKTDNLLRSDGF